MTTSAQEKLSRVAPLLWSGRGFGVKPAFPLPLPFMPLTEPFMSSAGMALSRFSREVVSCCAQGGIVKKSRVQMFVT